MAPLGSPNRWFCARSSPPTKAMTVCATEPAEEIDQGDRQRAGDRRWQAEQKLALADLHDELDQQE